MEAAMELARVRIVNTPTTVQLFTRVLEEWFWEVDARRIPLRWSEAGSAGFAVNCMGLAGLSARLMGWHRFQHPGGVACQVLL